MNNKIFLMILKIICTVHGIELGHFLIRQVIEEKLIQNTSAFEMN
jgi:uncharacterized protein YneF (UPF0154 family)